MIQDHITPQAPDALPSAERRDELRVLTQSNRSLGRAPYAGVRLQTVQELQWVLAENQWSGYDGLSAGESRADLREVILAEVDLFAVALRAAHLQGADLRAANLQAANLQEVDFRDAVLDKADLTQADLRLADLSGASLHDTVLHEVDLERAALRGADLYHVNLSGAYLFKVNAAEAYLFEANLGHAILSGSDLRLAILTGTLLQNASLAGADLRGAILKHANMQDAVLTRTELSAADLRDADLRGAILVQAQVSRQTRLSDVKLNNWTQVADVNWMDAVLTQVDWEQMRRIGDEAAVRPARGARARAKAYHAAARAYHGLGTSLRAQGVSTAASQFRLREQHMERLALRAQRKIIPYVGSSALELISGYGERPGRIFATYLLVLLAFTAVYMGITHFVDTALAKLTWDEALVLSITSFHGRGFFPGSLALGDWVARAGAVEAILGLFVELVFIATFSRRFLGG